MSRKTTEKEIIMYRKTADWLPGMVNKGELPNVGQISAAIDYDGFLAAAFCVELLEDVNFHKEAQAVNDLLLGMFDKDSQE